MYRAAALLAALCILTGCTYTVEVQNMASEQISVRLLQIDPVMDDWSLAAVRMPADETTTLGPVRVPFATVVFEAGPPETPELAQRITLRPGFTRCYVDILTDGEEKRVTVDLTREQ